MDSPDVVRPYHAVERELARAHLARERAHRARLLAETARLAAIEARVNSEQVRKEARALLARRRPKPA